MLIVYDEWSELLRELADDQIELVVKTVLNCNEAYAGFNGFAMVGGHEWTARESGGKKGTAVRRGFHAIVCHRLDDEYAKFLLKNNAGKKAALKAPSLPKGHAYFQDSEGEMDYILIPFYGKEREAVYYVLEMLPQIEGPANQERLVSGDYAQEYRSARPLTLSPGTVKLSEYPLDLEGPHESSRDVIQLHSTLDAITFDSEESDNSEGLYTPQKETRILLAAFQLSQQGKKVTRTAIKEYLGWNNKHWNTIKAVCDKHQIAVPVS